LFAAITVFVRALSSTQPFLIPVEYIKQPKAKRKPIEYRTPYLEPLPENEMQWAEMKEIRRQKNIARRQTTRENEKIKKKQKNDQLAVNNTRSARIYASARVGCVWG